MATGYSPPSQVTHGLQSQLFQLIGGDDQAYRGGVVLAMASSLYNCPLDPEMCAIGELGLSAEIRAVSQPQRRISEAARLGLKQCILPESCLDGLTVPQGMKAIGVRTLRQAVNAAISKDRNREFEPASRPALEPG